MDLPRRVQFSHFLMEAANAAQTCAMGGSCALGVAAVVAGRAEALIQTQQWPWDWVSAFMIKEAGGKVLWFHYRRDTLVQLKEPDRLSYSRHNRGKHGGLGFIGGNQQVVDRLWSMLRESWTPG